jgi:hypoxanthine phosphoribosyltransferase
MEPTILVGIGPGGAIIAGMIAKQLGKRIKKEPQVLVIDRLFRREGRFLSVEVGKADLSPGQKIILVTPEVHSGNIIKLVSGKLDNDGIVHEAFSFLV